MLNNLSIIDKLLSRGADINTQNNEGNSPLHIAVMINNLPIINKLLSHGANLNTLLNNYDSSPFYIAHMLGRHNIIQLFNAHNTKILIHKMKKEIHFYILH